MSPAPTHGMYAHASTLTGSAAASPTEARQNALEHARDRRLIDGRMFTGNLVCWCGDIVSEGWMPAHMRNNHPEEYKATFQPYERPYEQEPSL